MMLRTSERTELCLLVIPPGMSDKQGEEALKGAVTPGYASSPGAILDLVRERIVDDRVSDEEED